MINLIKDYHDCKKESQLQCECQFSDIHQNIKDNIIKEYKEKVIKYLKNEILQFNNSGKSVSDVVVKFIFETICFKLENGEFE